MGMKQVDFDTIVVGAGPGGATAASCLTQAGLRVLVVEKAHLPRYKACGGAIPRPTLDRFPIEFDGVIQALPTDVRLAFPGQPAVDVPIPEQPVVLVKRSEFDMLLLEHSNAEVLEGTAVSRVMEDADRVRVVAGEHTLTARYLVGADGATSTVAKSLGLRQNRLLGGSLEAEVSLNGDSHLREEYGNRALFSLAAIPWGYAWIFPKTASLSVGIARFKPGRVDLQTALHQEMDRLGVCLFNTHIHGHPVPVYQAPPWPFWRESPQEKLSTRRCFLVGDAAGLVDPLLGEGIRYAIGSARLAAQTIIAKNTSDYEAAIWQEMGHSLATAGLAADLFYHFPNLCYTTGLRNPITIRHIVDVLTEKQSYEGLGRRILGSSARWLLNGHTQQIEDQERNSDV